MSRVGHAPSRNGHTRSFVGPTIDGSASANESSCSRLTRLRPAVSGAHNDEWQRCRDWFNQVEVEFDDTTCS